MYTAETAPQISHPHVPHYPPHPESEESEEEPAKPEPQPYYPPKEEEEEEEEEQNTYDQCNCDDSALHQEHEDLIFDLEWENEFLKEKVKDLMKKIKDLEEQLEKSHY